MVENMMNRRQQQADFNVSKAKRKANEQRMKSNQKKIMAAQIRQGSYRFPIEKLLEMKETQGEAKTVKTMKQMAKDLPDGWLSKAIDKSAKALSKGLPEWTSSIIYSNIRNTDLKDKMFEQVGFPNVNNVKGVASAVAVKSPDFFIQVRDKVDGAAPMADNDVVSSYGDVPSWVFPQTQVIDKQFVEQLSPQSQEILFSLDPQQTREVVLQAKEKAMAQGITPEQAMQEIGNEISGQLNKANGLMTDEAKIATTPNNEMGKAIVSAKNSMSLGGNEMRKSANLLGNPQMDIPMPRGAQAILPVPPLERNMGGEIPAYGWGGDILGAITSSIFEDEASKKRKAELEEFAKRLEQEKEPQYRSVIQQPQVPQMDEMTRSAPPETSSYDTFNPELQHVSNRLALETNTGGTFGPNVEAIGKDLVDQAALAPPAMSDEGVIENSSQYQQTKKQDVAEKLNWAAAADERMKKHMMGSQSVPNPNALDRRIPQIPNVGQTHTMPDGTVMAGAEHVDTGASQAREGANNVNTALRNARLKEGVNATPPGYGTVQNENGQTSLDQNAMLNDEGEIVEAPNADQTSPEIQTPTNNLKSGYEDYSQQDFLDEANGVAPKPLLNLDQINTFKTNLTSNPVDVANNSTREMSKLPAKQRKEDIDAGPAIATVNGRDIKQVGNSWVSKGSDGSIKSATPEEIKKIKLSVDGDNLGADVIVSNDVKKANFVTDFLANNPEANEQNAVDAYDLQEDQKVVEATLGFAKEVDLNKISTDIKDYKVTPKEVKDNSTGNPVVDKTIAEVSTKSNSVESLMANIEKKIAGLKKEQSAAWQKSMITGLIGFALTRITGGSFKQSMEAATWGMQIGGGDLAFVNKQLEVYKGAQKTGLTAQIEQALKIQYPEDSTLVKNVRDAQRLLATGVWTQEQYDAYMNNQANANGKAGSTDVTGTTFLAPNGDLFTLQKNGVITNLNTGEVVPKLPVGSTKTSTVPVDLPPDVRKNATKLTDQADAAETNIIQFDNIIDDIDEFGGKEGLLGKVTEWAKGIGGLQDGTSSWKTNFTRIKNSVALESLPPGAASDTDVALVLQGYPDSSWDKEQLKSWIRGYQKILQFQADQKRFRAEYMERPGGRGSITGLNEAWKQSDNYKQFVKDNWRVGAEAQNTENQASEGSTANTTNVAVDLDLSDLK